MLNNKLISIIIPLYNVERYFNMCINSVLPQIGSDIEILLVDDGSPDNCGAMCDKIANDYPNNVRVMHQENKGLGGARNTGLNESTGEYVFFLDSDDTIADGTISQLRKIIQEHVNIDMIVFCCNFADEKSGRISHQHFSKWPNILKSNNCTVICPTKDKQILLSRWSACLRITKRSVFIDNNILFPERWYYEDLCTTIKLLLLSNSVYLTKSYFYNYYIRNNSIMSANNISKMTDMLLVFKDIVQWLNLNGLFNKCFDEIEFLCIDQLYLSSAIRIIMCDYNDKNLLEYTDFVKDNFPNYKTNKYFGSYKGIKKFIKVFFIDLIHKHKFRKLYLIQKYIYLPIKNIIWMFDAANNKVSYRK